METARGINTAIQMGSVQVNAPQILVTAENMTAMKDLRETVQMENFVILGVSAQKCAHRVHLVVFREMEREMTKETALLMKFVIRIARVLINAPASKYMVILVMVQERQQETATLENFVCLTECVEVMYCH